VSLKVLMCGTSPLSAQCSSTLVALVHSGFVCCCIQTRLTQNVSFVSPQQHSGYSRILNMCCIVHLHPISSQMNWK